MKAPVSRACRRASLAPSISTGWGVASDAAHLPHLPADSGRPRGTRLRVPHWWQTKVVDGSRDVVIGVRLSVLDLVGLQQAQCDVFIESFRVSGANLAQEVFLERNLGGVHPAARH